MFPTLDEVRAYAAEGRYRRVPVCMELLADRFTPTEVLRCLRSVSNYVFLLESAETDGTQGATRFWDSTPRWSFRARTGCCAFAKAAPTTARSWPSKTPPHACSACNFTLKAS